MEIEYVYQYIIGISALSGNNQLKQGASNMRALDKCRSRGHANIFTLLQRRSSPSFYADKNEAL
jgi:hypothetical protein